MGGWFPRPRRWTGRCFALVVLAATAGVGCAKPKDLAVVFFCDGAGWYSGSGQVKAGLHAAGFEGRFATFTWSSFLGAGTDHLINARSRVIAHRLTLQIETERSRNPGIPIHVMGLSAGTAVVLSAIEQLGEWVQVDSVVLFSPSVSAKRDLTQIMQHVRGQLYATSSPYDGILNSILINADGLGGPPAGSTGFRLPPVRDPVTRAAYRRVINLHWRPSYAVYNWHGGHTGVVNPRFVRSVIAPRIMSPYPYPLDRSIMDRIATGQTKG